MINECEFCRFETLGADKEPCRSGLNVIYKNKPVDKDMACPKFMPKPCDTCATQYETLADCDDCQLNGFDKYHYDETLAYFEDEEKIEYCITDFEGDLKTPCQSKEAIEFRKSHQSLEEASS